jgi:predicted esterase
VRSTSRTNPAGQPEDAHAVAGAEHLAEKLGIEAERLAECHLTFIQRPQTLLVTDPEGPTEPAPLIVGLHGMGMVPAKLAEWFSPLFDMPLYWAFPSGPYPYEVIAGKKRTLGNAWYIYTGDEQAFLDSMHVVGGHLDAVIAQVRRKLDVVPSKQIVLGFSQGAYMAGDYVMRRTSEFAGLIIVGGRIKVEALEDILPTAVRLPILAVYGKNDRHIPLDACRESMKTLEKAGFPVEHVECDGGHEVTSEMISAIREWLGAHA